MKERKNQMKRILGSLIVLTLLVSQAFAGSSNRRGTAGAQELLIPVGSVGTALGGSFNAAIEGIEAAYWNPAGVAAIDGQGEALFSHMNYLADINVEYAAIAVKVGATSVLGASLKNINFGDIAVTTTDEPDGTGETYSPSYITLGLIYSRNMTDRIRFGGSLNLINEQIMRVSATGVAINAGVQYQTENAMIGVSLRNLGTNMIFSGADLEQSVQLPGTEPGSRNEFLRVQLSEFELPTQMEMGVAFKPIHTNLMTVTVGGSFLNDNFSFDQYTVGVEVNVLKTYYIRGSYALAENPDTHAFVSNTEDYLWGPGLGAGLNLQMGQSSIKLDYAVRKTTFFSNTQWLTIRVGF